ncbi:MAG: metalloregulator ArsR/SmtB family transcription factor [Gemmatimonadota bacterium]
MKDARTAAIFRALSDPTRLAIIARLRSGEVAAGDIAAPFQVSRPAISRHIRVLRRARLVRERRDGRNRFYSLAPAPLQLVDRWIATYRIYWQSRLHELKTFVESDPNF